MPYTRSGRKKSNRRTRKVLTHLPAPLFKSPSWKQTAGAATIKWATFGEFLVTTVVGQTNTTNACFNVQKKWNDNGFVPNSTLRLGARNELNFLRGVDTSGSGYYLKPSNNNPPNSTIAPEGDYDGITVDSLNNPIAIKIDPVPVVGGSVTLSVQSGKSWIPGATAFVYRRGYATGQYFFGKVASYSGFTLVIDNISEVRGGSGDYKTSYNYNIECVEPYTPVPSLYSPMKIAIDSASNIFILEQIGGDNVLRMYSTRTNTMSSHITVGMGNGQIAQCNGIAVDPKTDIVYANEFSYNKIYQLLKSTSAETFSGKPYPTSYNRVSGLTSVTSNSANLPINGNQADSRVSHPKSIAFDPIRPRMYVAQDSRIVMVDCAISDSTKTPTGDWYYYSIFFNASMEIIDMVVDNSGNLFFINNGASTCIYKVVPPPVPEPWQNIDGYHTCAKNTQNVLLEVIFNELNGKYTWKTRAPVTPAGLTPLKLPFIFAGQYGQAGYIDDVSGNAKFNFPTGLSVDSNNIIYVADYGNSVIRGIYPNGTVFTVAGKYTEPAATKATTVQDNLTALGAATNFGDGTNTTAAFSAPVSVAVDSANNIYVADRGMEAKSSTVDLNVITLMLADRVTLEKLTGPTYPYFNTEKSKCGSFVRIRKINRLGAPSVPTSFTLVTADSISATFSWDPGSAVTGFESKGYNAYFQFLIKPSSAAAEVSYSIDGTTPYNPANKATTATTFLANNEPNPTQKGFYQNNMITLPLVPLATGAYSSIKLVTFNGTGQNVSDALTDINLPAQYRNYTILLCGQAAAGGPVNGGPRETKFNNIRGIAADSDNNLYVAEWPSHVIRKITPTGTSTTFFGTGAAGASLTQVNTAAWLTFSYGGGWPMYIADWGNSRVLSVTSAGVATVFNTSGVALPQVNGGIAVDSANNVYVIASASHCIYMITPAGVVSLFAGLPGTAGSTDGTLLNARFNGPQDIHYDTKYNCLYVCDSSNHLIRKITLTNPAVSTLAGNKTAEYKNGLGSVAAFNIPYAVTTDADGYLYVTDNGNHCIRKVSPAGFVSIFSGTQGANAFQDGSSLPTSYDSVTSDVKYSGPMGICASSSGMMYITESGGARYDVRALSATPPPTLPSSIRLSAITSDSITIAWAGDANAASYSFTISPSTPSVVIPNVPVTTKTATFTGLTECTQYTINMTLTNGMGSVYPTALVYTTKIDTAPINLATPTTKSFNLTGSTTPLVMVALSWTGMTRVSSIGYTLAPNSGAVIRATMPTGQRSPYTVAGLQPNMTYTATITGTIPNVPDIQSAGATTPPPNITYSETTNEANFTTAAAAPPVYVGTIAGVKGTATTETNATATPSTDLTTTNLNSVRDIATDAGGNIYVSSTTCILIIRPPTPAVNLYTFDATQVRPTPNLLSNPPLGLPGSTIALFAGSRITAGAPSTTAQSGSAIRFGNIMGMVYSSEENCLYVSDSAYNVIVKVTLGASPTSVIVAGKSSAGNVDGALNTNQMNAPKGLTIDRNGFLYIADYNNSLVRKLSPTGTLSTISASPFPIYAAYPSDIAVFPDGSVYTPCANDHTIRKLSPDPANPGKYIASLFAGINTSAGFVDGPLATAKFNSPQSIAVDSNYNIYIYDAGNYAIRIITGGNVYTYIGSGSGNVDGEAATAKFTGGGASASAANYTGLFSDAKGNLYLSDTGNGTIRLIANFPVAQVITQARLDEYKTSGAQASSAVQQKDSGGQQQAVSGAQSSSAQQQKDSGGQQQKDSSAQQQKDSSAQFQRDSSAVQQKDSGGQQQKDSSAKFQRDSSAVKQKDSSAQFQRDSSAVQQKDSGGQQQTASASKQQRDSSAVQQSASSAVLESVIADLVSPKDDYKGAFKELQAQLLYQLENIYRPGITPEPEEVSNLQADLGTFEIVLQQLLSLAAPIYQLNPNYKDGSLLTLVEDNTLSSFGVTKYFDTLRNRNVFLDVNNNIVESPLTPYIRAYTSSGPQSGGGKHKHKKDSRKSGVLFYRL